MSTKKKLMEVVKKIADINNQEKYAHNQIAAYEIGQDTPKLTKELARLYAELERKKNTKISKTILFKNDFENNFILDTFECKGRRDNFILEWDYDGCHWCDTVLRNVADLEDALDLCGIDKEIKL